MAFAPDGKTLAIAKSPGLIQLVDPNTGDLSFVFDLPHWQRGLLAALREDLKRAVVVENDVNLAAVAELHTGAAKGIDDFVLVWLDRGGADAR